MEINKDFEKILNFNNHPVFQFVNNKNIFF